MSGYSGFLFDTLKSQSRTPRLEIRIVVLEASVSPAQTKRDSAGVDATRGMEKGKVSRHELTVARAEIEELRSLVASTSQSETLLIESYRSRILELRDAQATIKNWRSSLRELLTSSSNEVSALRHSLVILFDRFDDVLSTHEFEVSLLSAYLRSHADTVVSRPCVRDYARQHFEETQMVLSSLQRQATALKSDLVSQEKKLDVVLRSRACLAGGFTRLSVQSRKARLRLTNCSMTADEEVQAEFRLFEHDIAEPFCTYTRSIRERSQRMVQEATAAMLEELDGLDDSSKALAERHDRSFFALSESRRASA